MTEPDKNDDDGVQIKAVLSPAACSRLPHFLTM